MKNERDFFQGLNIKINNEALIYKNEISEEEIFNQIRDIVFFHNRIIGYKENIIPRFNSTIGKEVEGFKVSLKKIKKNIDSLEDINESLTKKYLKSISRELILKAEEAITMATGEGYYDIILRSMNRYELCIGRGDRGNLKVNGDEIIIGTTKYMSYNLIEHDLFSYVKRLRRKKISFNALNLIDFFIKESKLDDKSIKYIKGLLIFPYEEIKIIQRYFNNKLELEEEEIIKLIKREIDINEAIYKNLGGLYE